MFTGLEREFRGSCLPPGDASAFAPVDAAWLSFFAKLAFSKEAFLESFTAIMYDIMMFALLADRDEVAFDNLGIAADFVYPPLEPQYVSNQEVFPTVLTRYWQVPAAVQFLRYDTFDSKVSGGGEFLFISIGAMRLTRVLFVCRFVDHAGVRLRRRRKRGFVLERHRPNRLRSARQRR